MSSQPHPKFSLDHCANCAGPKAESWHLLCDGCFDEVPERLALEMVNACKSKPNSGWHHAAIDAVLESIEVDGRNMPDRPGTLSDGSSHYVNRGVVRWPIW